MNDKFKLTKFNNSMLKNPDVTFYSILGYFHYKYIETLEQSNSIVNIVKDNGNINRGSNPMFVAGDYIRISMANFSNKRQTTSIFRCNSEKSEIVISDLISLIEYIEQGTKEDGTNSFVKFDFYTIVN